MQNGQNKNQWIKLFDLCGKIKSKKGKLFQFSGEGESLGEHKWKGFCKARFTRHISKKLYLFSLGKRRLGKIVGHLKIIVKKMVTNGLLYPVAEGQEKIILIYSQKEQATYLENPLEYKDS